MNCGNCGKVLYPKQRRCSCGWKKPLEISDTTSTGYCEHPGCPNPGVLSHATFAEGSWLCPFHFFGKDTKSPKNRLMIESRKKQADVDEFIRKQPMQTKRESCLLYLREKGLLGVLPESLQEAIAEREAIQSLG